MSAIAFPPSVEPIADALDPEIDPAEIPVVIMGEEGWAEYVVDWLCEPDASLIIVGPGIYGGFLLIEEFQLNSRKAVWPQVRQLLKEAGARVPRARWSR